MKVKDDTNELDLCDTSITIIYECGKDIKYVGEQKFEFPKYAVEVIYHDGQWDEPISLAKIKEKYEGVRMVISEDPLSGKVYRYGNHGEFWEEVGKTEGYA